MSSSNGHTTTGPADRERRNLSTADLAAATRPVSTEPRRADEPPTQPESRTPAEARTPVEARPGREELAPLFSPENAREFRARWTAVQTSFVDDPRRAVKQGDELVAQVMHDLAQSFASERARLEGQLDDRGEGSTENLRVALRRYRSFFERLLSL